MTLPRLIHANPTVETLPPRVIGIDDWSRRRGRRYGTVIVERRRPIDLLPDCAAETVVAWLRAHPQVAVIARDRGVMYLDGATRGRRTRSKWSIGGTWKNLGEALERLFVRKHDALAALAHEVALVEAPRGASTADPPILRLRN